MQISLLKDWLTPKSTPLVIAGPCSAESEEQVMTIASELAKSEHTSIFRAGIWKPRTRPNAFEGMGLKALPWLQKVRTEIGMPVCTEVANAEHVEAALKHGIDILWIGARTTAGPFAVQEIADALRGVDIPVLVKNPINAELALWEGALERFNAVGITKLVAIHRGFSGPENHIYRNLPLWSMPMQLKRKYPGLPIICDPSHIAGTRKLLPKICQKAIDLDFDGLMIETHNNPDQAKSDAQQQITPAQLVDMLDNLHIKTEFSSDEKFEQRLEELRGRIDRFDDELLEILRARMEVALEIGREKKRHKVTALQKNRLAQMMLDRLQRASDIGLSEDFAEKLFDVIHDESVKRQTEIGKED